MQTKDVWSVSAPADMTVEVVAGSIEDAIALGRKALRQHYSSRVASDIRGESWVYEPVAVKKKWPAVFVEAE